MIHFDFDDRYQDELTVGNAMSWRDGALLSVVSHVAIIVVLLLAPQIPIFQQSAEERQEALQARLAQQRESQDRTFVFVQPKLDLRSPQPPPRAELSDQDRAMSAPRIAPNPVNPLPYARGNSTQRVEESKMARAGTPEPTPGPPSATPGPAQIEETKRPPMPQADAGYARPREIPLGRGGSALGEALKNLQKYTQDETFNNPQGSSSQQPGAAIQFDTKGVEFGPWIRRFVSQVKRNWFVPSAAWLQRGHVVLQFNIHKDGHITDIAVVAPSAVDAFNRAAYNAILTSNPTEPLPPEYPSPQALFTVTFYYNEQPPSY